MTLDEIIAAQEELHLEIRRLTEGSEEYTAKVKEVRALYKAEYAITGGSPSFIQRDLTLEEIEALYKIKK